MINESVNGSIIQKMRRKEMENIATFLYEFQNIQPKQVNNEDQSLHFKLLVYYSVKCMLKIPEKQFCWYSLYGSN